MMRPWLTVNCTGSTSFGALWKMVQTVIVIERKKPDTSLGSKPSSAQLVQENTFAM